MKKLFKLYILALLTVFYAVSGVSAETIPTLSIEGTPTISLNGENIFNIKINTNKNNVSKVAFKIEAEHDEYVTIRAEKGETVAGSTNNIGNIILTSATDFMNDGSTIATITVKNNGGFSSKLSSSITLSNIIFTYGDSEISGADSIRTITLSNITTTTVKPSGSNAKLRNIGLNNGASLSPEWSSSVNNYKVYLLDTIRSLSISPDCETCNVELSCGNTCTITPSGGVYKVDLAIGKNEVVIKSKSTDGKNTEEYKLTIYRGETTDNSPYLASLEVNGYLINEVFDKKTIDYSVTVPFETDFLEVFAIAEDSAAKVDIKGNEDLQVGNENIITVTVTSSETKDKTIYNIVVTRLEEGEELPEVIPPITDEVTPKKTKWGVIIGIIIAGALIIGTSAYAIFGRKNAKKKNDKKIVAPQAETKHEEVKSSIDVFAHDDAHTHTVDTALIDIMNTKEIIREQTSTINLQEIKKDLDDE